MRAGCEYMYRYRCDWDVLLPVCVRNWTAVFFTVSGFKEAIVERGYGFSARSILCYYVTVRDGGSDGYDLNVFQMFF